MSQRGYITHEALFMNNNTRSQQKTFPQIFDGVNTIDIPNDPQDIADIGYEFIEMGMYREAYQCFCYGIALDDADPDLLNGLGISLCELGEFDKSRIILDRSLRIDPSNPITLANIAAVCWEQELYDQCVYYYNRSLEYGRDIEETHLNLINCYLEMGLLYMAFLACNDFMKLFPDHEEGKELMDDIILNMGISLY